MKQRLQQNQNTQTGQVQQQSGARRREFSEAEEVIRADREETPPPVSLGSRLADSIAGEPASTPKPWWRRLFS